jgi:hypothetical protein
MPTCDLITPQLDREYEWLDKVFETKKVEYAVNISWVVHHTSKNRSPTFDTSITSLLPLFLDPAHSVETVGHVVDRITPYALYFRNKPHFITQIDVPGGYFGTGSV